MEEISSAPGPSASVPDAKSAGSRKRKPGRHAVACESCHRRKQRVSSRSSFRCFVQRKSGPRHDGSTSDIDVPW